MVRVIGQQIAIKLNSTPRSNTPLVIETPFPRYKIGSFRMVPLQEGELTHIHNHQMR